MKRERRDWSGASVAAWGVVLIGGWAMGAQAAPLSPGDIAVVGYQSDTPDGFAIVALRDLPAGATFVSTDNGWESGGSFRETEGYFDHTLPTATAAGTVIPFSTNVPAFSGNGDQLFLLNVSPLSGNFQFLYGLQMNGGWQSTADSSNTSADPGDTLLPADLKLAISPQRDNAVYSGPRLGTEGEIRAAIANPLNWTSSDSVLTFDTTAFTIGAAAIPEPATVALCGVGGLLLMRRWA